ncbi:helix-turn-helix domain-containing protein [Vibrio europaeus]|uniref:helix-turn-helix domain-containing protein n=1 Tax=Vibrio europaeus TaxID=300876 RepID=UPI00233ECAA7|nr:helix-turn-helix transcriptional regulator [Vibrio europaeus]MDC5753568.1 helix-turn-helix domain-containing protein [Vibrio europaeus]MDC5816520.1 helix-turn-helix domain-containing protein [Vibrio europaeus]
MTLGEKIRAVREAEQHGRQEFSQMLDIPKDTLVSVEKGQVKKPNFEMVSAVCRLYPQYVNFLIGLPISKRVTQIEPKSPDKS